MEKLEEEIRRAAEVIKRGGVILYPTDTVWGLGCDARNAEAVSRIYDIKQRDDAKSLIILAGSEDDLWRYVDNVPDVASQLIEAAVRPTTIIYDRAINMAPNVIALDGSIGVRITSEAFSRGLCRAIRRPLVSTSANVSGRPTPRFFDEISDEIKNAVDYIVDYRRNDRSPSEPSMIIKISDDSTFKIIRK